MKRIIIGLIIITVIFGFWKVITRSSEDNKILLADLAEKDISLFAKVDNEVDGVYKGLLLKIKGEEKEYNWENLSNPTYYPELYLSDIDNDKKEELIIILTDGTGSGFKSEKIYVLDIQSLEEYDIDNPLDIISQKVDSTITINNEKLLIKILINGKEIINEKEVTEAGVWNESLGFGSIVDYTVDNGVIRAIVPAAVATTWYIGEVRIDYKYHEGTIKDEKLEFILFRD